LWSRLWPAPQHAGVDEDPKKERTENGRFAAGNSGRKRKRDVRADGLVNAWSGHGTPRDPRQYTTHVTHAVNDINGIDLRRGNWIARRICEWLPSDCFSKGYTLKLDDKEQAEKVMEAAEDLGVNQRIVEAGAMERAAGGAALFPALEGALGDLSEPMDMTNPKVVKVNAIHLLEPRELLPASWYSDINNPKFRMPETYRLIPLSGGRMNILSQQVIHESRLVIFPGRRVTAEPQPGQRWGWGDNELTTVDEAIKDFGISWGSAATILKNYSQRIFKWKGLADILKEEGGDKAVEKRAQIMDMVMNVLRAVPIDAEDDIVQISTSVGGLADLLTELAQFVCAAADMTMTRLFGRAAGGLNATGEGDQQIDHDKIISAQKHKYTKPVEHLLGLIMASTGGPIGGQIPKGPWSIEWVPLKNQDAKELAETRKLDAEADQIRIDSGVITADDAAESHFKGDTYGSDIIIDWKRREAQKKIDEEAAANLQPNDLAAMGRKPSPSDPAPPVAPQEPTGAKPA
jgi:phage-related protein (TIGR01555 family)